MTIKDNSLNDEELLEEAIHKENDSEDLLDFKDEGDHFHTHSVDNDSEDGPTLVERDIDKDDLYQ